MCIDFLTGLNAASSTIETKYLSNDAQTVIYTCETDDSSFTGSSQNPPVPNKSRKDKFPWYGMVIEYFSIENIFRSH